MNSTFQSKHHFSWIWRNPSQRFLTQWTSTSKLNLGWFWESGECTDWTLACLVDGAFRVTRARVSHAVLLAYGEVSVPWGKLFLTSSLCSDVWLAWICFSGFLLRSVGSFRGFGPFTRPGGLAGPSPALLLTLILLSPRPSGSQHKSHALSTAFPSLLSLFPPFA